MKKIYLLATALAALVSCTSEDFTGDQNLREANGSGPILFASSTPSITRSTGVTAAEELGYSFYVYATKTVSSTTSNVFALNEYSSSSNTPYGVWYEASSANKTQSNTYNWEYVGAAGAKNTPAGTGAYTLSNAQTIKYWDYAASLYVFTAYQNKNGGSVTNVTTNGFTFSGTPAQFADLYVADKLPITSKDATPTQGEKSNNIGNVVEFTFRSGATKVRLGIYHTISGYEVMNVNFKKSGSATFAETDDNAMLSGSFNGGGTDASATSFTITYDASNHAQFGTTETPSPQFNFGSFDTDGDPYLGKSSVSPTWANGNSNYISVFPNQDHTSAMVLSVDFDLYNTVTHETIHVEDAKAVVPEAYMIWNPNYAYTYLFKICDNTNGYTGPAASPTGLYPITFDAVTVAATDVKEGSITTVSTPSITTYQSGSVVDIETTEPLVSEHGITYAHANGPIYITVNTDGNLETLTGNVALYEVAAATTEADLLLASDYPKTQITSGDDALTVQASETTVNSVTFPANKYATFTPTNGKTYAFEYSKAVSYVAATGTFNSSTTYYTDNTGATEVDTTGFEEGVTNVTSYFVASPAVKAYKIIKVVES